MYPRVLYIKRVVPFGYLDVRKEKILAATYSRKHIVGLTKQIATNSRFMYPNVCLVFFSIFDFIVDLIVAIRPALCDLLSLYQPD